MKKTICLSMIVRNESQVILKCLESVKSIIDYFIICDTGSTDNTISIIESWALKNNVLGSIHTHEWTDFATNRNMALALSKDKADYSLIIDADEYLVYSGEPLEDLKDDGYEIISEYNDLVYKRIQLLSNKVPWCFHNIIHEYPDSPDIKSIGSITSFRNIPTTLGSRSKDPNKYYKDCLLLEIELGKYPTNTRYIFYLAQSYKDCGNYKKALEYYNRRLSIVSNTPNSSEIYISYLESSRCKRELGLDYTIELLKGYEYIPNRLECPYEYWAYLIKNGLFINAYNFLKPIIDTKYSPHMFAIKSIYNYKLLLDFSICSAKIYKLQEALIVLLYLYIYRKSFIPIQILGDISNSINGYKGVLGYNSIDYIADHNNILCSKIEIYRNKIGILSDNKVLIEAFADSLDDDPNIFITDRPELLDGINKDIYYYNSSIPIKTFIEFVASPRDVKNRYSNVLLRDYVDYYIEWMEKYINFKDYSYMLSLGEPPKVLLELLGSNQKCIVFIIGPYKNVKDHRCVYMDNVDDGVKLDDTIKSSIGWILTNESGIEKWKRILESL
jgi:hypothetical protein